jgi:hypothetical protein
MNEFEPVQHAKNLRRWIDNSSNRSTFCTEARSDIENNAIELTPILSLALDRLATWEGVAAECKLLENDSAGWEHLHRSYLYLTWSRRVRLAFLDIKRGQKIVFVSEFALLLAHAIAIKDDEFADFLGARLIRSLLDRDKRYNGWDLNPVEPFIAKLYARWRKKDIDKELAELPTLPAYEAICNLWHDTDRISLALKDACDYHFARNEAGADAPEFYRSPYRWFPVEILAVLRLRQDEGLENSIPDHPIMKTLFCDLPRQIFHESDPLLDKIIKKVRSELPIGDPW